MVGNKNHEYTMTKAAESKSYVDLGARWLYPMRVRSPTCRPLGAQDANRNSEIVFRRFLGLFVGALRL